MKAHNDTAMQLLAFAYNARDYQFVGAPGWARSERFDVNFTPDQPEITPGSGTSRAAMDAWLNRQRQRLQAVLRDRFGLVLRAETKELPLYALTVAKGGHKLSPPADPTKGQSLNINNGRQIAGRSATVGALVDGLSMVLGRFVRNDTGLDGAYDYKVDWAPDSTSPLPGPGARPAEAVAGDTGRASIFTALTEQLGLRLESRKGPVPVFVIAQIERPSEN